MNFIKIMTAAVLLAGLSACSMSPNQSAETINPNNNTAPSQTQGENKNPTATKPNENEVLISAVGDIIVHDDQLKGQYNETSKTYDFTNNFKFIKSYISSADLSLGNLETTFGGQALGYRGYPTFNCPDTLVDALKDTGFDVLTTANNHCLDTGAKGVLRTVEVLKNKGVPSTGTKLSKSDEDFIIKEVKGMKLGITSYTFETPSSGGSKTINSIPIPKEVDGLISSFNPNNLDAELPKMKQRIDAMKKAGAEVIIFSIHWGNEYELKPASYQKKMAQALNEYGVDIILGSHPHVLQPAEFIKSQATGKETFVIYSLGNFISNQQYERTDNRYTEDGVIMNITLSRNAETKKIEIKETSFMPTWVHRYDGNNKYVYEILPLFDALKDKSGYNLISEDSIWRAENSQKNTFGILEDNNSRMVHAPAVQSSNK